MTDLASALREAHDRLGESAQSHKRAASAHRRSARELRQAQERLELVCKSHGITLDTAPKEAQS